MPRPWQANEPRSQTTGPLHGAAQEAEERGAKTAPPALRCWEPKYHLVLVQKVFLKILPSDGQAFPASPLDIDVFINTSASKRECWSFDTHMFPFKTRLILIL